MLTSFFATLALMVAPVLCIVFSDQDRTDFNVTFPNGIVAPNCVIRPETQLWDRTTHEMLDKYIIGAQSLNNPSCQPAHGFLSALPQLEVNPALDIPPPEE